MRRTKGCLRWRIGEGKLVLRAASLLLLMVTGSCGEFPSAPPGHLYDPDFYVVVRGRVTDYAGAPLGTNRVSVHTVTNDAECKGELWGAGPVTPDRDGVYQSLALSPGLLPRRRCVWVIVSPRFSSELKGDTAGGIVVTLRSRHGRVPLDTLTINVVLRRHTP